MRFIRHVREWRACLAAAESPLTWRTWLKMLRGLVGRHVPARVWRARARTCQTCPIFDRELRRCAGPWVHGRPTGCGCYLVWQLHVARPYPNGCWGREFVGGDFGWPTFQPKDKLGRKQCAHEKNHDEGNDWEEE